MTIATIALVRGDDEVSDNLIPISAVRKITIKSAICNPSILSLVNNKECDMQSFYLKFGVIGRTLDYHIGR